MKNRTQNESLLVPGSILQQEEKSNKEKIILEDIRIIRVGRTGVPLLPAIVL